MPGVGVYRATFSGTLAGQFVENVMYFDASVAPGSVVETTQDLLSAINTDIVPAYLSVIPTLFTGLAYSAQGVTPAGGPRLFSNLSWGGVNGDRSGAITDSSNSPVVLSSNTGGPRTLTGKIFIPGVTITDLSNNVYDTGFQSAVGTFAGTMISPITAGGSTFRYTIFSRASNASNLPDFMQLSLNPGTQRRRMRPLI